MTTIDASDIPVGLLLAALYNNSRPVGFGIFGADAAVMTQEVADALMENGKTYFDYLHGRSLKIQLNDTANINPHGYDRDNGGAGALLRLVEGLRTRREEGGESRSSAELQEEL